MKDKGVKNVTRGGTGRRRMTDQKTRPVSFLITVWLEPQQVEAEPEWRWRVRPSQADQVTYFRRVADVLAFIASESGSTGPR